MSRCSSRRSSLIHFDDFLQPSANYGNWQVSRLLRASSFDLSVRQRANLPRFHSTSVASATTLAPRGSSIQSSKQTTFVLCPRLPLSLRADRSPTRSTTLKVPTSRPGFPLSTAFLPLTYNALGSSNPLNEPSSSPRARTPSRPSSRRPTGVLTTKRRVRERSTGTRTSESRTLDQEGRRRAGEASRRPTRTAALRRRRIGGDSESENGRVA